MKLLYDIKEQSYLVLNIMGDGYFLFKVDNVNPPMLSRIIESSFCPDFQLHKIIDEMGEFAKIEIEKLQNGW